MMKTYEIFPEDQALALCEQIRGANWLQGKARTAELTGTVKQNEEILDHVSLQTIGKRIVANPEVQLDAIPLQMHKPKYSRYAEGGAHYGFHTDAPWMGSTRTDLSCTLFLADPASYDGGELVVGTEIVKLRPGQCVIYDCGTPHEVRPVTRGERICVVTWIQSRIRDPQKRKLIGDYRRFLAELEKDRPDLFLRGGQVYSQLLRMWIE